MADLEVQGVSKEYPARGEPLRILQEVSLRMSAGENAAILGPSGSGKSTLLHILGVLESPTTGDVRLGGDDPFALNEAQQAQFRSRRLGFIFQNHHLLPQLSVLENVLAPALAEGSPDQETVQRAKDLLDRVGLQERLEHRPAELSGGEQQRVGVARALLRKPQLLLADEPTGNLDRGNAQTITKLLLTLQAEENTMLLAVTHSRDLAAAMQARYQLRDGALVKE